MGAGGVASLGFFPHVLPAGGGGSGPPFAANSADNGLSVDPTSFHIVMGNGIGGATAALLSRREIPLGGFDINYTGAGGLRIGTSASSGARLQIADTLAGAAATAAIDVAQTWNTTGVPVAIKLVVTDTASGNFSELLDIRATGKGRWAIYKDGSASLYGPVNVIFLQITATNQAVGSSSGGTGKTTQLNLLPRYFNSSGAATLIALAINAQVGISGGTGDTIDISLASTINQTGGYVGDQRGIYYNPIVVSLLAGNRNIAYENAIGDNYLNSSGGVTTIGQSSNQGFLQVYGNAATGILLANGISSRNIQLVNSNGNFQILNNTSTINSQLSQIGDLGIQGTITAGNASGSGAQISLQGASTALFFNQVVGALQLLTVTGNSLVLDIAGGATFMNGTQKTIVTVGTVGGAIVTIGDVSASGSGTIVKADDVAKVITLNAANGVTITGNTTLLSTGTTLANAAGAALGTLSNAPTAGNPAKWIQINDNGTIRKIPTWI